MLTRLKSLPETTNITIVTTRKDDLPKKANSPMTTSPSLPLGISSPSCTRRNLQQDLTDLLTCPVCLEEYQVEGSGEREPLFLTCHHSLCRTCIPKLTRLHQGKYAGHANMGEVSCPECRVVTLVPPSGLTQNFYLVSLIDSKRKKPKEPSRLRMWCGECDGVALESCVTHHLTHLSSVLASAVNTYTLTKTRLTSLLQVRARQKEEEVRLVKEAVEQLDRASLCLRRRLVANLDHAALVQVTANSLLHEVEEMTRRVESEGKVMGKPTFPLLDNTGGKRDKASTSSDRSRRISSPAETGLERDELEGLGRVDGGKAVPSLVLDSSLRKTRSDLSELVAARLDLLNFDSPASSGSAKRPAPSVPRRASESTSCPSSAGFPYSGSSSPSINFPHPAYDHLSCQEQETKITLLRQCLASLEAMETSLVQEDGSGGERGSKGDPSDEDIPSETLMEMFKRAVEAVHGGSDAGEEEEEVWMKVEQEDNTRKG